MLLEKIESKEQSYAFLYFLFTNRKSIFGNGLPDAGFNQIPVFCEGKDTPTSRHDLKSAIYYHEKEIDDLTKEFTDKIESAFKAKSDEIMKL